MLSMFRVLKAFCREIFLLLAYVFERLPLLRLQYMGLTNESRTVGYVTLIERFPTSLGPQTAKYPFA